MKKTGRTITLEQKNLRKISADWRSIQHMESPSEAVQIKAMILSLGRALQFVQNPSEAVQLVAVSSDSQSMWRIKNPSEAVQLAAVNENGLSIQCIKNPSEAIQVAAFVRAGPVVAGCFNCFIDYAPSALDLANAIRATKRPFDFRGNLTWTAQYAEGIKRLVEILMHQPASELAVLADAAPGLFENIDLAAVLERAALRDRSLSVGLDSAKRSM